MRKIIILLILILSLLAITGYFGNPKLVKIKTTLILPDRHSIIPTSSVKMTANTDKLPSILHSNEWETPVALGPSINTTGGEDSVFIMPDGNTLYFFFTPDVSISAEKQVIDKVTRIYVSKKIDGWPFVSQDGQKLWFTRTYRGSLAIFRSLLKEGNWQTPKLIISQFAGEPSLDKVGNLYFTHHYYDNNKMLEADIYVAYKKKDLPKIDK